MKRFDLVLAMVPVLALPAAAQTEPPKAKTQAVQEIDRLKIQVEKMVAQGKMLGVTGAAMGSTVKGAPYSAVEVSEFNQTLGDGTRIRTENRTQVYRDSEGRVRRETPDSITIWDPVASVSYVIDPKAQTARKMPVMRTFMVRTHGPGTDETKTFAVNTAGPGDAERKIRVEMRAHEAGVAALTIDGKPGSPETLAHAEMRQPNVMFERRVEGPGPEMGWTAAQHTVTMVHAPGKSEPLGHQMIEGVNSEGTRNTTTLEAGAIGNDRPIEIVGERWYSPELQTLVMSRHSDPRTGEESFRLTNVSRTEPAAYLFLVPAGYKVEEPK